MWPNEIKQYPDKIRGEEYLVIASGFFPPTKNIGAIYLLNKNTNETIKITEDKKAGGTTEQGFGIMMATVLRILSRPEPTRE